MVREAVKTLSGRGILRVKRGAGIFVVSSEKNVVYRLDELADALPLEGAGMRDTVRSPAWLRSRRG